MSKGVGAGDTSFEGFVSVFGWSVTLLGSPCWGGLGEWVGGQRDTFVGWNINSDGFVLMGAFIGLGFFRKGKRVIYRCSIYGV